VILLNPQYPVYVISKGRWHEKRRLTSKALNRMGVPYHIVVEPQEYDNYAHVINPNKILVLPQKFHDDYDPCTELEIGESQGSGPARNFCWAHSIERGYTKHWILDDNIRNFIKLNNNMKTIVSNGDVFRFMERFTEKYNNVVLSGPHYDFFAPRKLKRPPFIINRRIFSCILIRNDLPFRWRAKYNEDVDLALRVLKAGYATIQFYAYLQEKVSTQKIKGGNTDSIYIGGTLAKSKMIVMLHPDVAELKFRFSRWHHYVNYSSFRNNQLIKKEGLDVSKQRDYGIKLVDTGDRK